MKKNQIIPGIMLTLLLLAVTGVFVFAITQVLRASDEEKSENQYSSDISALPDSDEIIKEYDSFQEKTFVDENAQQKKDFVIEDSITSLTYSKTTLKPYGKQELLYLDTANNEYYFDEKENFLGSRLDIDKYTKINSEIRVKKNSETGFKTITQTEAEAIAYNTAKMQFGDSFDLVKFSGVSTDSEDGSYTVTYQQNLGEGKFARGLYCYVNVLSDGTVYSCRMPSRGDFDDFDEAMLEGITKEKIDNDLKNKTTSLYGDSLKDYTIENYNIINLDGKYYIKVGVMSQIKAPGKEETYSDGGKIYLYQIPASK